MVIRTTLFLAFCTLNLAACDQSKVICKWDTPRSVAQGVGVSVAALGKHVVVAYEAPAAGQISVLWAPGTPSEAKEGIRREPGTWLSSAQLHTVGGGLQMVAVLSSHSGAQRMLWSASGWTKEARGFRLRQVGSTHTADRLVVHGCELGGIVAPLSIHTSDAYFWSRIEIPDLCFRPIDPSFSSLRTEYDVGLAGDRYHVASVGAPPYANGLSLMLWSEKAGSWDGTVVQKNASVRTVVLPREGCCDRIAYVSPLASGKEGSSRWTIRVATRVGESWSTNDVGPPHVREYPLDNFRPTAMIVRDSATDLVVLRSTEVVVYRDEGDGWQAQRFETSSRPVSADIVTGDQGALHLVYETEGLDGELDSIYYTRRTCRSSP